MKIIFASKNPGKIEEVKYILKDSDFKIISLLDLKDTPEIIENGLTFEDNAVIKAEIIYNYYRIPTISDDSGLAVEQLNGEPGVFSARYAGNHATDDQNNRKLITELMKFPEPHYAKFICCAAFFNGDDLLTAEGEVKGKITHTPAGSNGFGYDPHFVPEGYNCTMSELSPEEKNKITHRFLAFDKLRNMIKQHLEI